MGKVTVIFGQNGSGKTRYAQELSRSLSGVRSLAFKDTYGTSLDREYYLQQRWNQGMMDEDIPTAGEQLHNAYESAGCSPEYRDSLHELLGLDGFMDKKIILLSSGELRKFQIAKTLLYQPEHLFLDNPFIGLDPHTRGLMKDFLGEIASAHRTCIYLLLSREADIPAYCDEVIRMPEVTGRDFGRNMESRILSLPVRDDAYRGGEVLRMNNVHVRYGDRDILHGLDWTVNNGDFWALTGRNGSGKSTLLSLICADNPQRYANDITYFGKGRGSRMPIWDIKKPIGYISPELHRSYKDNIASADIVASGLLDSVGLYVRPRAGEYEKVRFWMDVFGISDLADRSFLTLSSGEQRLVLLARAFVKDPDLLILDEPFHGLDDKNLQFVRSVIETFARRPFKSIIMVSHYQDEFPSCVTGKLELK